MLRNFPESDWKTLSRLKPLVLERLCRRILVDAAGIIARAQEVGQHRAYLDLYRHIHERDEILSRCFDEWKRSRALETLINWRAEHLLTDEEFAAFSPETRRIVEMLLKRD